MAPKRQISGFTTELSSRSTRSPISSSEESLHVVQGSSAHSSTKTRSRQPISPSRQQPPTNLQESVGHFQPSPQPPLQHGAPATMRSQPVHIEVPVTYTPTTGRVSKAKKGKRVHACEHPGCGKIFTRAEHRRRHQLNHNPEHSFPCTRPGCGKAFHRLDLLQRHQERQHDSESSIRGTSRQRVSTTLSIADGPQATDPILPPGTPRTQFHQPPTSMGCGPFSGPIHDRTDLVHQIHAPFGVYPDSSTGSEATIDGCSPFIHQRNRTSSVSTSPYQTPLHNTAIGSPVLPPTAAIPMNSWITYSGALPPSTYPFPSQILPQPIAEPTLSVPFSKLDEHEWGVICRDLSSVPGLIRDDDGAGILHTMRWQDCLECYWKYFHPTCPIIHKPTFFATNPAPLLAGIMVAIGSAYDTRADAKVYSTTLLETATRLVSKRERLTNKSRLADLQTVLLLEILGRFRSRRPDSEPSSRFRMLYAMLHSAKSNVSQEPLSLLKRRQSNTKNNSLSMAYESWVFQETKRRIVQACFVFDTEQHYLFGQPRTLNHHSLPQLDLNNLKATPLLPCDDELWETSPVTEWEEKAMASFDSVRTTSTSFDVFQARLLLSHCLTAPSDDLSRQALMGRLYNVLRGQQEHVADFTYHSLMLAKCTPVRELLTVAGESWLLGRKLENEAEFKTAKVTLRTWVDEGAQSIESLWHATRLLRSSILPEDRGVGERDGLSRFRSTHMLHEQWATYLAVLVCWAHGQAASGLVSAAVARRPSTATVSPSSDAAFSHTSHSSSGSGQSFRSNPPSLLDPHEADAEMRDYLHVTDVADPRALCRLDPTLLARTHGLIESVRMRTMAGRLGGLLNEAERVLFRLVEGRSRMSQF